ncbi:MAG TPA: hypothetical protein VNZ26_06545 [Vicinamibacterales bacterium]|jgi:hypothetical protein|nr:hypothetical protein [Vicinamibacterales bacterium]
MSKMSDVAIGECISELRAACRRPIEQSGIDDLFAQLRPNFQNILDNAEGPSRWADHGWRMRENGRHLGALADFFGYRSDVEVVGVRELTEAFAMVRDACRVGAESPSATADREQERL